MIAAGNYAQSTENPLYYYRRNDLGVVEKVLVFDWTRYFCDAIENAKSSSEIDEIYDHWAKCINADTYTKLNEKSFEQQ